VPVDEITTSMDLYTDLGLDSLQAIELLLFVEHQFNVSVSDETAAGFHRVGDVLRVLGGLSTADEPDSQGPGADVALPSALEYSDKTLLDRTVQRLSLTGLKLFFRGYFRVELENSDRIPKDRAYILAANHNSHLDSGTVLAAINLALGWKEARKARVLGARDYFFKSKTKGWIVSRVLNVVPIERKEASLGSLRIVKQILGSGDPVVIFPEGTRSRTGELQEFKAGLGLMAWESETMILPVFIEGTRSAMPVGRGLPRPSKIRVRFGEPIEMAGYAAGEIRRDSLYRKIVVDVREAIVALRDGKAD
jgi:long-chain acyl-CoA synthetase